jgi:protein-S-isoprenylcysteine O-methyltransferase Ste14
MASPFALYFYSAYRPGLNALLQIPAMAWLTGFFLPHIVVETSSTLINMHNIVGAILTVLGFLLFCITAFQVYYAKIFKKGIVTGGIYRYIRHPQYSSFALCSFGLLLLWPRFLVLVMFIILLFAYYFLARAEERECGQKFGQSYLDYKQDTYMFLPFRIPVIFDFFQTLKVKIGNASFSILIFILTLTIPLGLAFGIQSLSLNSLYLYSSKNTVYLSVSKLAENQLKQIIDIALSDKNVQAQLAHQGFGSETKSLNYVVPADWYISEIPMQVTESYPEHFLRSAGYDKTTYKIIFTIPHFSCNCVKTGLKIIKGARTITPILEVWLDLSLNQVIDIKDPPATSRYENVPVPVY